MKKYLFYLVIVFLFSCQDDSVTNSDDNINVEVVKGKLSWDIKSQVGAVNYPFKKLTLHLSETVKKEDSITIGAGTKRYIRELDTSKFVLYNAAAEIIECPGFEISASKDTLSLLLPDGLLANQRFTTYIKMNYFEKNGDMLIPLLDKENLRVKDSTEFSFYTSRLPTYIEYFKLERFKILDTIQFFKEISPVVICKYKDQEIVTCTREGLSVDTLRAHIKAPIILADGVEIPTNSIPIDDKSFSVVPNDFYKKNTNYKVQVEANWQIKNEGVWMPLLDKDGNEQKETLLKDIVVEDIFGQELSNSIIYTSYPMPGQFNFYPKEYSKAYLQFHYDVNKIPQINTEDIQLIYYKYPYQEKAFETTGNIDSDNKTIWFDIPDKMENEMAYRIDVISNSTRIHVINFRTSKYNSFIEKIPSELRVRFLYSKEDKERDLHLDYFGSTIYPDPSPDEGFCLHELYDDYSTGDLRTEGMIKITPLIEEWDWYNNSIYKYIYDNPQLFKNMVKRPLDKVPFPPVSNAFYLWQVNYDRTIIDSEIESNSFSYEVDKTHIINRIPYFWMIDYYDIRNELLRQNTISEDENIKFIKENKIVRPVNGDYSIRVDHQLPGKDIITSSKVIRIKNTLY